MRTRVRKRGDVVGTRVAVLAITNDWWCMQLQMIGDVFVQLILCFIPDTFNFETTFQTPQNV